MDVKEAIIRRRSIRKFETDRPVSDADIATIVEAGRQAPSWKNDQPWRFVVVRDPDLRERVAQCLPETNPAAGTVRAASAVIVLVGVPAEGAVHQDKPFWLVDCGIAGENMLSAGHGTRHRHRVGVALGRTSSVRPPRPARRDGMRRPLPSRLPTRGLRAQTSGPQRDRGDRLVGAVRAALHRGPVRAPMRAASST